MATTKLSLYNGALLMCGDRRLLTLNDNVEARYILDDIWDNGAVDEVLEHGLWKHAIRTVAINSTPDLEPAFGFRYAFEKPDDLIRLVSLCSDEISSMPLYGYQDDNAYWWADLDIIYVRYVSNAADYGGDMSLWPQSFCRYFEGYMALRAIRQLTNAQTDKEVLRREVRDLRTRAKSNDAQKDPVQFAPPTGWQMARTSGYWRNRERFKAY